MRMKNSTSTPVLMTSPCAAAFLIWAFSTLRGACATGLPRHTTSAGTQATSGFHGSWTAQGASGMANVSGSDGLMSRYVANAANPAPVFSMSSMATVGTSLERGTPTEEGKEREAVSTRGQRGVRARRARTQVHIAD